MTNLTPATELSSEELFSVDQLEVKCHVCGEEFLDRTAKTNSEDGTYAVFTMACRSTVCDGQAVLKVPRTESARRGVPTQLQTEESELHPDDGFSIAQLDVLLAVGGPSLLRMAKHDGTAGRTFYSYRPSPEDGTEVQVIVQHAS